MLYFVLFSFFSFFFFSFFYGGGLRLGLSKGYLSYQWVLGRAVVGPCKFPVSRRGSAPKLDENAESGKEEEEERGGVCVCVCVCVCDWRGSARQLTLNHSTKPRGVYTRDGRIVLDLNPWRRWYIHPCVSFPLHINLQHSLCMSFLFGKMATCLGNATRLSDQEPSRSDEGTAIFFFLFFFFSLFLKFFFGCFGISLNN